MNITELIEELQTLQKTHGDDVYVSGTVPWGNPEMTIHGVTFAEAGPLTPEADEANKSLPDRVVIEWKFIA